MSDETTKTGYAGMTLEDLDAGLDRWTKAPKDVWGVRTSMIAAYKNERRRVLGCSCGGTGRVPVVHGFTDHKGRPTEVQDVQACVCVTGV